MSTTEPEVTVIAPPVLVAVERQITLNGPDVSSGTFDFDALALTLSPAPLTPVFCDGVLPAAVAPTRRNPVPPIRGPAADPPGAGPSD